MIGESDVDPYAVLGVLVEGAAHTVTRLISAERQMDTAAMLVEAERLRAGQSDASICWPRLQETRFIWSGLLSFLIPLAVKRLTLLGIRLRRPPGR
jgi:hypothetical protein